MTDIVKSLGCIALVFCAFGLSGCSSDEPEIIGGPTQEILDWQARNRGEFQSAMKDEHGN